MKKIQYGILVAILPLVLAFSYYLTFSATKPISIVEDINQSSVTAKLSTANDNIAFKGYYFFRSYVPEIGTEIWRSDKNGNTSLAFETIEGPNQASTIEAFTDGNFLYYVITGVGQNNADVIYYLEQPSDDFKTLDLGLRYYNGRFKKLGNTWYALARDITTNKQSLVAFNGQSTAAIAVENQNVNYSVLDFTEFNGALNVFVRIASNNSIEHRRIVNDTIETLNTFTSVNLGSLHQTNSDLYYTYYDSNYDYGLNHFDGTNTNYIDSFSNITQSWGLDGDNLVFYARKGQLDKYQIWSLSGSNLQQLTNISDDYTNIRKITTSEQGLYFLLQNQEGTELQYLTNGTIETVILDAETFDNNYTAEPFVSHNGSVYVTGRYSENSNYYSAYWKVTNGVAARVLSKEGYFGNSKIFTLNGELYNFIDAGTQTQLYRLDDPSNIASLVGTFDIRNLKSLAADDLTSTVFATGYAGIDSNIFAVQETTANKLIIEGVTGSSNPKNFVSVKDKTYFSAVEGDLQAVWKSDGYSVEKVPGIEADGVSNNIISLKQLGENLLVLTRSYAESKYRIWLYDGSETRLLSENVNTVFNEEIYLSDDGTAYFLGGVGSNYGRSLIKITDNGLVELYNSENVSRLDVNDNGIFFQTGSRDYAELWRVESNTVKRISNESNSVSESYESRFYTESAYTYFSGCDSQGNFTLTSYSEESGISQVDTTELSVDGCWSVKVYELGNEIAIITPPTVESASKLWSLQSGVIELVSDGFYNIGSGSQTLNNRLYFKAAASQQEGYTIYVYADGEFVNTFLPSAYNFWLSNNDRELGKDWIILPGSGGAKIYSFDGSNVTLKNSLNSNFQSINSVMELGDYTIFQVINGYPLYHDLVALDKNGELTYLNPAQEFNFISDNNNGDYPIARGHGKWLFLQACHYTIGCEPFSMNINVAPVAKVNIASSTVYSGHVVELDGSVTEDVDGNILEYIWSVVSGPNVEINSSELGKASFIAPTVESSTTIELQLEVIDDGYDTDSTTQKVKVLPNTGPDAVINAPAQANEGQVVKLDATQSSDPESDELSFYWEVVSGQNVSITNQTAASTQFSVPSINQDTSVTVKLTVQDAVGNTAQDEVEIILKNVSSGTPDNGSGEGSSGGGGSTNWLLLLMLASLMMVRFGSHRR